MSTAREAARLGAQQLEEPARGVRIVRSAMRVGQRQAKAFSQRAQAVARLGGQHDRRQFPGVQPDIAGEQTVGAHKAQVEAHVVADHRRLADETHEGRLDPLERRRADHVAVGDPGDHGDLGWDGPAGVHQGGELLDDLAVAELHRADFDDRVLIRVQPGGFQVERDVGARQG